MTNPRTRADAASDRLAARSADPGMVIAFDKASNALVHPSFQVFLLHDLLRRRTLSIS